MAQTPEEFADKLGPGIAELKIQLMRRITLTVERKVKKRTRVDTGTLKRSWASKVERSGERGRVGTTVRYARWQVNRPLHEGLDDSRADIDRLLTEAGEELWSAIT